MVFWEALVLIVLIGAIARTLLTWNRRDRAPREDDGALRQSQAEIEHLRQRIQVLERVITDNHGSRQLDQEIERLRDR